ncbi:MAG TPA: RNA polymerase sigma factor SigW [Bacillota bacterium]|nr:RNA polymerase sigma factor SigW [Bacillota bacterium]
MDPTFIKESIRKVKKGDQQAFEPIVSFFQNRIFYHCYRMTGNAHEAEELAQEAFIRAYVNIDSFDQNRKFSTWLYRIATNLTIDRLRKRKPDYYLEQPIKGTDNLNMYSQLASGEDMPEEEVERLELQDQIQKYVLSLSMIYRSVIILRYIDELSLKEISKVLDIPLGTVKTRLHRGREALREKLHHSFIKDDRHDM